MNFLLFRCRFENDIEKLFEKCWSHSQASVMFEDSRCHDSWRHQLAIAPLVSFTVVDRGHYLVRLGARQMPAIFKTNSTETAKQNHNFYRQIVSHVVDRALGFQ